MNDYNLIFKDYIEGIHDESIKNKLITIFLVHHKLIP